jgi:hypothetical protein
MLAEVEPSRHGAPFDVWLAVLRWFPVTILRVSREKV